MVKVDIKKSFDSINQTKLLEIMDTVLKEVSAVTLLKVDNLVLQPFQKMN